MAEEVNLTPLLGLCLASFLKTLSLEVSIITQ